MKFLKFPQNLHVYYNIIILGKGGTLSLYKVHDYRKVHKFD